MTGDDSQFEANQALNAKGRIGPLRDTFFLVMSGDEISSDVMGDFIDTCFNPINLQFFIHKTLVDDGYEVLTDDYTKCYYEDKMQNHLDWFSTCSAEFWLEHKSQPIMWLELKQLENLPKIAIA